MALTPSSATQHPAVDVSTETAAIVLQERPVVPLSSWLADAVVSAISSGRQLQLVTPPTSRLTFALAETLRALDGLWVVHGADYYDGLRGGRLTWNGQGFAATGAAFAAPGEISGGSVRVDITVLHPAAEELQLGRLVELCFGSLTGAPPRGWGVAEPAAQPWSRAEVTGYCRGRMPSPSTLVVTGDSALGLLRVSHRPSGVVERLTLAVGGGTPGPDLDALDRLAADLAGAKAATVRTMLATLHPGRSDTTEAPFFTGWPLPYGLLIGPEAVAEQGTTHALAAPAPEVVLTGSATRPMAWCRLFGPDPSAALAAVLRHFGVA